MVNRCVCHDITFAEILAKIEEQNLDIGKLSMDEIADKVDCCNTCKTCRPYLKLALKTGRTEFDVKEVDGE